MMLVGKGTQKNPTPYSPAEWSKQNVFTILEENIRYNEKAKKLTHCSGVVFETVYQIAKAVPNADEFVEFRWAKNQKPQKDTINAFTYTPENMEIDNTGVLIVNKDHEFAFWLTMHARSRNSGNNQDGVSKCFMRYIKGDKAKKLVEKAKYVQRLRGLIVGDMRLPENDLKLWAKEVQRINIPNFFVDVDSTDIDETIVELLRLADVGPENLKLAFESISHQVRRVVDKAVKAGMLKYNKQDLSWKMIIDGNEEIVTQFKMGQAKLAPEDMLIDFFIDPEQDKRRCYSKIDRAVEKLQAA